MLRIGVMGCGSVADFGHVPAILETSGLELAAIFDPSPARLEIFQSKFGIQKAHARVDDFLNEKLDAVVIASPPFAHPNNAIEAARSGAHVLCEKPLADSEAASIELVQSVRQTGKRVFPAFVYRYSPVAQQIKRWIDEGIVGEIRSLRLIYNWNLHGQFIQNPKGEWIESPLWRGRMLEGGPLIDCGVHQIDLARWWLGSEVVESSTIGAWISNDEAPDHQFLHMTHENGALTNIEVSFTYGHTAREPRTEFIYELIGTGGVIRYDRNGYILEARHGQGTTTAPGASEKNFPGMMAAFRDALITGDEALMPTGEDGIVATRIAEDATAAAISARNIRLE